MDGERTIKKLLEGKPIRGGGEGKTWIKVGGWVVVVEGSLRNMYLKR
jgi:hypothetical protein